MKKNKLKWKKSLTVIVPIVVVGIVYVFYQLSFSFWLFTKDKFDFNKIFQLNINGINCQCKMKSIEVKWVNPFFKKEFKNKFGSILFGTAIVHNYSNENRAIDLVRLKLVIKGKECPISSIHDRVLFDIKLNPNEFKKFEVGWVYSGELHRSDIQSIELFWNNKKW